MGIRQWRSEATGVEVDANYVKKLKEGVMKISMGEMERYPRDQGHTVLLPCSTVQSRKRPSWVTGVWSDNSKGSHQGLEVLRS